MPHCFAESGEGLLLIASGRDPVLRWDGVSAQAEVAGVAAPTTAVVMATGQLGTDELFATSASLLEAINDLELHTYSARYIAANAGFNTSNGGVEGYKAYLRNQYELAKSRESLNTISVITGTYYAYMRYVDKYGNFSSLSPLAGPLVVNKTGKIQYVNGTVSPVLVTANEHGLSTGDTVTLAGVTYAGDVVIPDAQRLHRITVTGTNTFTLDGTQSTNWGTVYTNSLTGAWTYATSKVAYTSVETTPNPKVARRQILRNTSGQTRVFYVDVDTTDMTSTSFYSTKSDAQLAASPFQVVIDSEGRYYGNQYDLPPDYKTVFVAHLGRVFAAVDLIYDEGAIITTNGSLTVTGIATEWTTSLRGRMLYVVGADKPYEIDAVDQDAQTLTLREVYLGQSDPYSLYAIKPAPAESRAIHWSGPGQPEAWNPFDSFALQDDSDQLTGMMRMGSYLYILERRHIYRLTYQADPGTDGYPFLACDRGCLNQRCFVVVEDRAYLLDEQGIHEFGGSEDQTISDPIQDFFNRDSGRMKINWAAERCFHAVHYVGRDQVKWFICLSGHYLPRHALVYDYRLKAWWVEEYAVPIASSAVAYISGQPYVFLGTVGRRTVAWGEQVLDGPNPQAGTVRGTATSATLLSLTDTSASFSSTGLVGNPVCITEGAGKGQRRVITAVTSTKLSIDRPWLELPDATSVYQVGGIPWQFRSGKFWFVDGEDEENMRRLAVSFTPTTGTMDMRLYLDRSDEPLVWGRDYNPADTSGVRSEEGKPDLVADLSRTPGYVQKRFGGHRETMSDGPRCVSFELGGVKTKDEVTIHSVTLDGADQ